MKSLVYCLLALLISSLVACKHHVPEPVIPTPNDLTPERKVEVLTQIEIQFAALD